LVIASDLGVSFGMKFQHTMQIGQKRDVHARGIADQNLAHFTENGRRILSLIQLVFSRLFELVYA
jgi:hypothetical protein